MQSSYDAIIIGAGMSGIAAGIRLANYGKSVCILEKHSIPGGLNSYYQRGPYALDVGLHALTNFAKKGDKSGPFGKVIKQLKIPYDDFKLSEQKQSKIVFPGFELSFSNNPNELISSINSLFPSETDGFLKLIETIKNYNPFLSQEGFLSAKSVVAEFIKDSTLLEMIFTPILIYGSANENDIDFPQFVIMFKSLYLEGLSKPNGGVRTIINLLTQKAEEVGLKIHYKTPVAQILQKDEKVFGLKLQNGEEIISDTIFSSIGYPETLSLLGITPPPSLMGKLSFCESLMIFDQKPTIDSTLIFYNENPVYKYQKPDVSFDPKSAVLCFPNNFQNDDLSFGMVRVTSIANFEFWETIDRKNYLNQKEMVLKNAMDLFKKNDPSFSGNLVFSDVFTPKTIKKFTGHFGGAVYGSPNKIKDGRTNIEGLYVIGTDQGFLGIIGSLLSGISMANLHGLMGSHNAL
jgi:phytoene dehydrogenase-like protein